MKLTYGSYEFDDNVIGMELTITPIRDKRGRRKFSRKEVTIRGALRASSQANFKTAIEAFETAFTTDLQDFKLLHDNDDPSAHTLINSQTYSGVRCGPIKWLNKTRAEYATVRSFEVTLTADYLTSTVEIYTEYRETISIQGTGEGDTVWTPCLDGTLQSSVTYPVTPITVVQAGSARGSVNYPSFPPYVIAKQYIQGTQVVKEREAPRLELNVRTDYGIKWRYPFVVPPSLKIGDLRPISI